MSRQSVRLDTSVAQPRLKVVEASPKLKLPAPQSVGPSVTTDVRSPDIKLQAFSEAV